MFREDLPAVPTPATDAPACLVCRKHLGEIAVPGGVIYEDDLLYVGHVELRDGQATAYLGHLLVEPRRHAPGLADLTDVEAAALGALVARVSRALRECAGAEHVYAFVLGDAVPHLHVHVVPRYPGAPREFWGVRVDEWPEAPRGGPEAIEVLCADLRAALVSPPAAAALPAASVPMAAAGPATAAQAGASLPPTAAHLILYVRDQERARAFYQAALGFAPRLHVPGMTEFQLTSGAVLGLMPEAGIRSLLPKLPDPAAASGVPRAETYLVVASPAAAHARAVAAGASELSPVLPRDWGDDAGYCLDPDGHVLAFAAPTEGRASSSDREGAADPPAGTVSASGAGPAGGPASDAGPAVDLRPLDPGRDLATVAAWVERPEVRRWWGDPGVALADLVDRAPGTAAMVAWGGRPVGVLCWQVPSHAELEEAGLTDLLPGLVDIDLLIGEPEARGRGVAAAALRRLCARLWDDGVRWVGLAAATANASALAAYAKAGFAPHRDFVENGEGYRYLTRDLTGDG